MKEINHANFSISKSEQVSLLKIQGEVFPFTEQPSDKYIASSAGIVSQKMDHRINPNDLFSLFTADVISKKIVFVR